MHCFIIIKINLDLILLIDSIRFDYADFFEPLQALTVPGCTVVRERSRINFTKNL